MESKVCMNEQCGASLLSSVECKKGWRLRSGELASLCDSCGTVYEQLVFCDTFHSKDTGWRECTSCGKRLHCGCIASSSLLELLDSGGVKCISCSGSHGLCSVRPTDAHVHVKLLDIKSIVPLRFGLCVPPDLFIDKLKMLPRQGESGLAYTKHLTV